MADTDTIGGFNWPKCKALHHVTRSIERAYLAMLQPSAFSPVDFLAVADGFLEPLQRRSAL
jgi:hypothetical protein